MEKGIRPVRNAYVISDRQLAIRFKDCIQQERCYGGF